MRHKDLKMSTNTNHIEAESKSCDIKISDTNKEQPQDSEAMPEMFFSQDSYNSHDDEEHCMFTMSIDETNLNSTSMVVGIAKMPLPLCVVGQLLASKENSH